MVSYTRETLSEQDIKKFISCQNKISYLFSKQVCIQVVSSGALSSYSSWNWIFYGTRKSDGAFRILSAIVNSPSEVIIHCATASSCYGNKDVDHNSVRDVASGAQGFLQSLGSCFQSSLISKDEGDKLRGRSIYSRNLWSKNKIFFRDIFWLLLKFSLSQWCCESVQLISCSFGNEIFDISDSLRPTCSEPHTEWTLHDGADGTTAIVCSCA